MASLTVELLSRLWPHASSDLIAGIAATGDAVLAKYQINTPARIVDFMAQISEETGGLVQLEENLNYTSQRAAEVWPSQFKDAHAAEPYAHNPKALANLVYGGRYGNRPGTDDGYLFRGRGPIQITFRSLYEQLAGLTGLDLVGHPELALDPKHVLEVAAAYWHMAGINSYADSGDFLGETKKINGGTTNYEARQQWREIWRLAISGAPAPKALPIDPLADASTKWVQTTLNTLKIPLVPLVVDGVAGNATRDATRTFQIRERLVSDGIAGINTIHALQKALTALQAPVAGAIASPTADPAVTQTQGDSNMPDSASKALASVPTASESPVADLGSWGKQFIEHIRPAIVNAIDSGVAVAEHAVPGGFIIGYVLGPQLVDQWANHAVDVVEGMVESGAKIELPTTGVAGFVSNLAYSMFKSNDGTVLSFLEKELDTDVLPLIAGKVQGLIDSGRAAIKAI